MSLWQLPGSEPLHPAIEDYTVGNDRMLDKVLLPYDIDASKVHVTMLGQIGILTSDEVARVVACLEEGKSTIQITNADEDGHSAIERYLIEKLGDTGKKIHTYRSRNDQVLVALRLFMRDMLGKTRAGSIDLAEAFLSRAEKHKDMPFPGYSHGQQAMPSSGGHYYASFVELLIEDINFLDKASIQINANPLGSAAGFGVAAPVDRDFTTKALGFGRMQRNTLACQNSRGKYESVYMEALIQLMMTLEKYAENALRFTTHEFGFFDVAANLTTGSSIMPNKKNLDGLEILQGQSSVVSGHQHTIRGLAKGLPPGYNRASQLMKEPLIRSADITRTSLDVAKLYVEGMEPRAEAILLKMSTGMVKADLMNILVAGGMTLRDAFMQIKAELAPGEVDFGANIASKISPGAPGNLGLELYRAELAALKENAA